MKPIPTPIDVPLSTLDQLAPLPEKPLGRFVDLINTEVTQYEHPRVADGSVTHVRVESRRGFSAYSTTVKDESGATTSAMSPDLQLVAASSGLDVIAGNRLYSRSTQWLLNSTPAGKPTVVLPQTLRSRSVYAANSQVQAPDMAMIGNISCTVWKEISNQATSNSASATLTTTDLYGIRVMFRDESTGTDVRPVFTFANGTPYKKARVVTDGSYFYVFVDNSVANTVIIVVYDATGAFQTSTTVSTVVTSTDWDVTYFRHQFVVLALPLVASSGVTFYTFSWNGTTLTMTNNTDHSIACGAHVCAWVKTPIGTGGTLQTVDNPVTPTIYNIWASRISSGLVADHTYPQVASGIGSASASGYKWISGMTGYVHEDGSGDLTVAYTVMDFFGLPEATTYSVSAPPSGRNDSASDFFPDQLGQYTTTVSVPFSGTSTNIATRRGLALVSRPFAVGSDYCALAYYPARKWGPLAPPATNNHLPYRVANANNLQPTWYVIPLDSEQAIVGRFEYALAAADWQVIVPDNTGALSAQGTNRVLATPCALSTGAIIFPAAYRIENIPSSAGFVLNLSAGDNTIGLKQFTIGPDVGRSFSVDALTFVPGLMAGILDQGFFSEHGLCAYECPAITVGAVSAAFASVGQYLYRMVAEYTSRSGLVDRSLPSPAFAFTATNAVHLDQVLGGHPVYPTLKKYIIASAYRTAYEQIAGSPPVGVATSSYYKITSDLTPLYNDTTAASFAYSDVGGLQGTGEVLYTDQGLLPRYPAPAFRGGCVWQNRAWLIAYDGSIWFSGERVEGESPWFNQGFRITVPADDEITAIAPMDSFLLILCANSIWYLPQSTLPDATGDLQGSAIPVPIRLPFESGGTGATAVIREGCAYASSTGGAWLITRSLENKWLGQSAKDYLSGTITDMVLDGQNRLIVTNGLWLTVYDTVLGGWMKWAPPLTPATLIGVYQGQLVHAGAFGGSAFVWQQQADSYVDDCTPLGFGIQQINMAFRLAPLHLGGKRTTKCIWNIQLQGEVFSDCYINTQLTYDDFPSKGTNFPPKRLTAGSALLQDFPPTIKRSTSIGIYVESGFNGDQGNFTPGRGFAVDLIGVLAGVEKGLTHFPGSQRVKGSTI